ncbi:MAG: zinc ribbon domain-containing protein, partial [Oscillospiraceae bacterium]|nr:zinc ribbon domain-containing protein [Oscillospiraceae bacterium]
MFCEKCGTRVDDGQPFCPNCGNRLGAAPAA